MFQKVNQTDRLEYGITVCLFQIFIDINILVQQSESLQTVEDNHCSVDFTIEKKHEIFANMLSDSENVSSEDSDNTQNEISAQKAPSKESFSYNPPKKCRLKKNSTYTENGKPKKSKLNHEIITPTCPSCKDPFIMDYDHIKSPIMSMNCEHTICCECVQHYVEKNKKKQNKNNINVCSCPIETCGAKRSFNRQSCNFNEQLISFYELIKKNSTAYNV